MRNCRLCGTNKPIEAYSIRNKTTGTRRTECKQCLNTKRRLSPNYGKWHKENAQYVKTYIRNYDLQRYYGITQSTFDYLFEKQNGKCAICKTTDFVGKGKKLHVDHCHATNAIRGLLCNHCNIGLGAFKDNIDYLKKAMVYLENYGDTK